MGLIFNSTYLLTVVPEPSSMLDIGLTIGFDARLKHKLGKNS